MSDAACVVVARLRRADDPGTLAAAAALVDDGERRRAARFVHIEDHARHLLGRALARTLLSARTGTLPAALVIRVDTTGKPVLDGPAGVPFNLAHSGDWILCALGVGNVPVGVDVQRHEPKMAEPDAFGAVFGARERAAITAAPDPDGRIAAFARAWARKEALLKAEGAGLSKDGLDAIEVLADPGGTLVVHGLAGRWTVRDLAIDAHHAGAVAWLGADGPVRSFEFDLAALGAS